MTTSTTVLYPTPTPTANTLNHYQRSRLLKSTRKIGDVLGTTPYLLESSELPVNLLPVGPKKQSGKSFKRQGPLFSHSASSSTSSFGSDSSVSSPSLSFAALPLSNGSSEVLSMPRPGFSDIKHGRAKDAPTPLFIHLNAVPVSPSDSRFADPLPPTPSGTTPCTATQFIFPPTPGTPTFDQSEVNRKRMAKLTRYLGEAIPPHLIYDSSKKDSTPSARKRRSLSVGGIDTVPELGFSQHKPAVICNPKPKSEGRLVSWVGEWNRDDIKEVQKKLRALK